MRPERLEANPGLGRALGGLIIVIENVGEAGSEKIVVLLRNERRDITALPSREGAEIVDAMYVVRVGVCIPHRIDVAGTRGEQLEPKFRWRIDQNRALIELEQRPVPRSLVAGIGRGADVAITSDDRDAERSSCSEECELHESYCSQYRGGAWKLPRGEVKSKAPHGSNHDSLARGVSRTEAPGIMTIRLISDSGALDELAEGVTGETRLAVDLEAAGFHRYSDRVCLLQVSGADRHFVVDTLAVDPSDVLRGPLESPTVTVLLHGGDYDLRLLDRDLDLHPVKLFDTQIAAALLGEPSLGLAALLEKYLDVRMSKKYQRADWAQRPLPDDMLEYAASDTRHLHELADLLIERLEAVGRRSWAEEESALMETLRWNSDDDVDPVTRVKGVRGFELREVALLREAWLWRDEVARARDRAPFRVAGDPVLLEVIGERPPDVAALGRLRGFSPQLAERSGRELLDRLEQIDRLDDSELVGYPSGPAGPRRPAPEVEDVANRLKAIRNEAAEALGIARGVLMSNTVILEIARTHPNSADELAGIAGVRRWQSETLADRLLAVL